MSRALKDSFIDKAGQEVRVGDYIVYGHALGRCAALKFGKVLKIETVKDYREECWRIRVLGIEKGYSKAKPWDISQGTLQFPDRTILANSFLPKQIKDALECSILATSLDSSPD